MVCYNLNYNSGNQMLLDIKPGDLVSLKEEDYSHGFFKLNINSSKFWVVLSKWGNKWLYSRCES